jgi:hypothetical protein
VLAAIVLGVVGELSGCAQVGFVTDMHGRVVPGSANAIGLFSHGVPVHLDVGEHRALPERIRKIRSEVLDVLGFRSSAAPIQRRAAAPARCWRHRGNDAVFRRR